MNRALRAATMGALLAAPLALGACSAGQVNQTASQDRDKVGPLADAGDIVLRQVLLPYPDDSAYEAGDDAELTMAIVNRGNTDDTLTGIESDLFGGVTVTDPAAPPAPAEESPGATPGGGDVAIPIPARSSVYLGEDVVVELTDLDQPLTSGQNVELTLTFEQAGEVTVPALVGWAVEERPREEGFDFHHGEEAEAEAAGAAGD